LSQTGANDFARIRPGFKNAGIPDDLIDALFDAYAEAKRRFYLGDHRPNEVEGGRFVEGSLRILELKVFGAYTPVGKQLPAVDGLIRKLESTGGKDPSLTIHIPRQLLPLYTIRNKRDVAHLGPDISPNLQDATAVVNGMDYVMAEFVRLYHQVNNTEAQQIIDGLVTREVPVIQMFGDYPKLLKDKATLPEHLLILLYRRGAVGATKSELGTWTAKKTSRVPSASEKASLSTTLRRLDAAGEVHIDGDHAYITMNGQKRVETKRLVQPA
jgi:hypothetical protein